MNRYLFKRAFYTHPLLLHQLGENVSVPNYINNVCEYQLAASGARWQKCLQSSLQTWYPEHRAWHSTFLDTEATVAHQARSGQWQTSCNSEWAVLKKNDFSDACVIYKTGSYCWWCKWSTRYVAGNFFLIALILPEWGRTWGVAGHVPFENGHNTAQHTTTSDTQTRKVWGVTTCIFTGICRWAKCLHSLLAKRERLTAVRAMVKEVAGEESMATMLVSDAGESFSYLFQHFSSFGGFACYCTDCTTALPRFHLPYDHSKPWCIFHNLLIFQKPQCSYILRLIGQFRTFLADSGRWRENLRYKQKQTKTTGFRSFLDSFWPVSDRPTPRIGARRLFRESGWLDFMND